MKQSQLYRRLRFYAGNAVRAATIPWKQHRVTPDEATTLFACSFGDHGWHHLRKTLEEYDADPQLEPRESTLFRYLTQFCPGSICDLLDWRSDEPRLPLFVYPWGTFRKGEIRSPKTALTSRFCGPSSSDFAVEEYRRTIRLYEAMKGRGYRPWHFGNTFVGGTLLLKRNGDRRFVVLQGNHRFAILAHLGVAEIRVRDVRGFLSRIDDTDAPRWPLVANGTCSAESALRIFDMFFELAGHQVPARLTPAASQQNVS